MMRPGLRILGVHSDEAAIIGDRMDTDIVAGIESGLDTVLVLSGVTVREEIKRFPYRPRLVLNGVRRDTCTEQRHSGAIYGQTPRDIEEK